MPEMLTLQLVLHRFVHQRILCTHEHVALAFRIFLQPHKFVRRESCIVVVSLAARNCEVVLPILVGDLAGVGRR